MSYPSDILVAYTLIDNVDDVLATHPNTLSSEINTIETKLGVDSSIVVTTIDYFLKHASGAYRTHIHDASSDDGAAIPLTSITNYPFKTGDWIMSTVTTARTGWTNVSATYSNKFMRINATPLTTGGADTHTHTTPNHSHNLAAGVDITTPGAGIYYPYTVTSGAGTTGSGDNVPAYVQVVVFQKD